MAEIRLDAFCDSVRDGTHDTPKPVKEGRYLVTSKAIRNNTVFLDECYYISQKDFDSINKRSLVEKWDVLMTMIGSVGRLLLVKDEPNYAIKNIALFKLGDELKAKWLYYYLSNPSVQNYFEMIASGTSQHFIGLGHLRRLKIDNLHSTSRKIVSILSAYDNLIENNNRRIRLLEQMAENLYKEWFVRFRFPGHEKVGFENGLPKGWKIQKYNQVATITAGGDKPDAFSQIPTEELKVPIYSNGIVDDGLYGYTSKAKINKPCVTISARGTVGFVCMRRTPFVPIVRLLAVVPHENLNVYYLYHSSKYNDLEGNGTSQQQLTVPMLNKRKIVIPQNDLLVSFENEVEPIYNQIDILKKQSDILSRQRDLLLPRLMSGKLEVKV